VGGDVYLQSILSHSYYLFQLSLILAVHLQSTLLTFSDSVEKSCTGSGCAGFMLHEVRFFWLLPKNCEKILAASWQPHKKTSLEEFWLFENHSTAASVVLDVQEKYGMISIAKINRFRVCQWRKSCRLFNDRYAGV
jgi:hypothetical protein